MVELHATSLFFTNFPVECSRAEMWRHSQRFGQVVDVFVPKKRSREGKEFGSRFWGVRDAEKLVKEIRGVKVGANMLSINVLRFRRDGSAAQNLVPTPHHQKEYHVVPSWKTDKPPSQFGNQKSFREVFVSVDQNHAFELKKDLPEAMKIDQLKEEEAKWLDKWVVGEVRKSDTLNNIFYLIKEEGFQCVAKYVGGYQMLLECNSKESMLKMLTEGKQMLEKWFAWICTWQKEKELVCPGWLIWVSLEGIPLHVWLEETFAPIAKEFG